MIDIYLVGKMFPIGDCASVEPRPFVHMDREDVHSGDQASVGLLHVPRINSCRWVIIVGDLLGRA